MLCLLHSVSSTTGKVSVLNKCGKGFCSQAEPLRKIIKNSFPPNGCFKKTFPSPTYTTLHNSCLFMRMKSPSRLPCSPYGGGCDIWRSREENMVLLICLSAPGAGPRQATSAGATGRTESGSSSPGWDREWWPGDTNSATTPSARCHHKG